MEAALYYAIDLPQVKEILNNLTSSDIILSNAKKVIEKSNLARDLTKIASCYKYVGQNVTFFKTRAAQ